jgi:hypothetical protein
MQQGVPLSLRTLMRVIVQTPVDVAIGGHLPPPHLATCGVELDLDQPGGGGIVGIRVFGGGFVPAESVDILEGAEVAATTKADGFGSYSVHMSILSAQFPTLHTFHAHANGSGRTSNNAGFTA